MDLPGNSSGIFTRYDVQLQTATHSVQPISNDACLQEVADCIVAGNESEIVNIIEKTLQFKSPTDIINLGLVAGMKEVSRLYNLGAYFLPQVILSSDAMIAGIALCERKIGRTIRKKARVITHTVEGDIHDIGQVIVNTLLSAEGFEVINLGSDVPVDDVVEACKIHKPILLTGTALMTTTMTAFSKISAKLKAAGLMIPFICGGGAVNEDYVTGFDLGIWGKEAHQAPGMAEDALQGLPWDAIRRKWNG